MRVGMIDTQGIRQRWEAVGSRLDERGRRVFAAGEVRAAGWGGLAAVSAITGLARSTIGRGLKDLDAAPPPKGREARCCFMAAKAASMSPSVPAVKKSTCSPSVAAASPASFIAWSVAALYIEWTSPAEGIK